MSSILFCRFKCTFFFSGLAVGLVPVAEALPGLAPGTVSPTAVPGVGVAVNPDLIVDHLLLLRSRKAIPQ